MSLTYEQTRLIRATVPIIRQDGERISTLFYTNMIRDHPGMHAYFNPVSMQTGHQPRAFTRMMLAFASSIHDISGLVARMEKVAQKHASLSITPELYDIVGTYLLQAFGEVLGPHCWNDATRTAWERAYAVMAGMLMRREEFIYRDFGSWVGWRRFVVSQRWVELAGTESGEGDTVTFEVRPEDGRKLPSFQPGQYVSLRVSGVPGRDHPQLRQYYLCGDPAASSSTYRFTVKRDASREAENYSELSQHSSRDFRSTPRSTSSSMAAVAPSSPSGSRRPSPNRVRHRGGSSISSADSPGSSTRPESPPTSDSSLVSSPKSTARAQPGVVSSMLIDQVREGGVLELTHPAGEFTLEPATSETPIVLISAGVGAAPLLSMLKTLLPSSTSAAGGLARQHPLQQNPHCPTPSTTSSASSTTSFQREAASNPYTPQAPPQPTRPVSWVHGSRQQPLYAAQVRELVKENPDRLRATFFKTRLADSELLSYTLDFATDLNLGRVRPVEDLYLSSGRGSQAEYYVCGPQRFLVEVQKYLDANRVDPGRVRYGMLSIGVMEKKD